MNLKLAEAAQWLGVHEQTLIERARAGKIPGAAKPGKCWVFPKAGLEAYLNSISPCPFTSGVQSGGSNSTPIKVDIESLLGLPTRKRRRNSTNGGSRSYGAGTSSGR